ncbi:MAG: NAD(P)/FAD-dependent oxidoreductase [Candidatus Omnitrophica bacterium]|nr:NAD(P)/FAD-dependent oxidoreductase [Candidatus Omnitrophota bacterium]
MEKVNITITGAGVVGLSIAAELSKFEKNIFVLEKYDSFGQETSSRNSEVIHAGINYPKDSLKTKACIEGKHLLYEFCTKHKIAHKRIGKLVVAVNAGETKDLEDLFKHGLDAGVQDLEFISRDKISGFEPNIKADAAMLSPSTGILDTHSFMKTLVSQFEKNSGSIAYNTELTGIDKTKEGFMLSVKDKQGEGFKFLSRIFINCAGLNSDRVSAMAELEKEEYKLKYCKGDYFRVAPAKAKLINRLIYPVPKKEGAGLGIHATLDMAGSLRLGPDDEYVKEINYDIDPSKVKVFYESARRFFLFIELKDITADMSGIRPKLQGPGETFRDFIIKDEAGNGFPGFINLIGIESPGLTASLSIAKMVANLVKSQN